MANKQRMVIKLSVEDRKKRKIALTTAAGMDGVISFKLGDDNRLVVVGKGTDVVELTKLLRKKLGYADVISVTSAEENTEEGENSTSNAICTARDYYSNYQNGVPSSYGYPYPYFHHY